MKQITIYDLLPLLATKALKEISQHYSPEYNKGGEISHKALKEMEGVK